MASFVHFLLAYFSFCLLIFGSDSQYTPRPSKFFIPLHQDNTTNLYVANIQKRTPLVQVPVVVDLNGNFLWVTCAPHYLSSTYRAPLCRSAQCARASPGHFCRVCSGKAGPGCHNNTCGLTSVNPVTLQTGEGELAEDVLSIQSTQGSNPGPTVRIPRFLFACAPNFLLQKGLPASIQGVAGLGHAPISLPYQIASHFGFPPTFALCLARNGVLFFGRGPYYMQPGVDVSHSLSYTPLIISPRGEYYINVTSININNKPVPGLNTALLSVNRQGIGGTTISTTTPYTVLEHSIFRAVTQFFSQLSGIQQVKPVQPFGVCFDAKRFSSTRVGPAVPDIDLVLQNQNVVWRIFGANSMVQARPGVLCLAFVDGGVKNRASIALGSYQLQDNLVQFDLATSRLGFSSSLLFLRTSCNNFNSTAATSVSP